MKRLTGVVGTRRVANCAQIRAHSNLSELSWLDTPANDTVAEPLTNVKGFPSKLSPVVGLATAEEPRKVSTLSFTMASLITHITSFRLMTAMPV
jgi:hypothetical protein